MQENREQGTETFVIEGRNADDLCAFFLGGFRNFHGEGIDTF